jgi:hypothetical protein
MVPPFSELCEYSPKQLFRTTQDLTGTGVVEYVPAVRHHRGFLLIAVFLAGVAGVLSAQSTAQNPAQAPSETPADDTSLYVQILEMIVDGDTITAVPLLHKLIDAWPDSPWTPHARELLSRYEGRLDRSGITLFSITNLLSTVALAEAIPAYLQADSLLTYGLAGLAGVGLGIGGSWLLSKDVDLSFGQELWMDTAQAIGTADFALAYDLVTTPGDAEAARFLPLGSAIVTVAARAAAYAAVVGAPLSAGKPAFVLVNYATSVGYTLLLLGSVFSYKDRIANDLSLTAIPTTVALVSYFLWDGIRWPDYRSGLTLLGALGGGLAGVFADLVVSQLAPQSDSRPYFGIVLGTALAGHVVTAILTKDLPPEKAPPIAVSVAPQVAPDGAAGISVKIAL